MKTIYLKGDIGFEITAEKIRSLIDVKSTEKLQVVINSPGGFVFEAYEIYDIFEQYKGKIEFVLMPFAASAASYIVMAGKNSKIKAFKNSIWMAHRISSIAWGDADDLMQEAKIMQALEDVIIKAYQKRIKMDKSSLMAMMKSEMWLIGWEQLTESGIIDDVIDSVEEIELPDEEKEDIKKVADEIENNFNNSVNLYKMKVSKTQARMKNENEKVKNMYERIAAKFEINSAGTPDDNIINPEKEDNKMKLDELLKANPEAKAEYDSILESAKAEGKAELEKVQDALNSDRSRIAEILDLASAELKPETVKAIEEGMNAGEYAKAEIARQKAIQDKASGKDSPFAALVSKQTPGDQTKNALEADDAEKESSAVNDKIAKALGIKEEK